MAADSNAGAGFSIGVPRALFQIPRSHGEWAIVSDGSRFLIAMPAGPDTSAASRRASSILIADNWIDHSQQPECTMADDVSEMLRAWSEGDNRARSMA